ncbi:hypothetical protein TNCV_2896391 [Trichonephila clavipes]|nr:hypothetical protein TNCV_2896391 [Trichonephila clavipes]
MAVGSLVVRASDSRPEGLGSMLDVTKYPPSAHGFTCRNCGGGDERSCRHLSSFGEVSLSLNRTVTCGAQANDRRTSCPSTMNFVGLVLTTSDRTATAGSDVVQSGRPIFDDFFQHLWPYIGNNTANVVFQMVKRLWLICIDH